MNVITRPTVAALLLLTTLTATTLAQQKRQTPAKPQPKAAVAPTPAPTFDTLIPAESYALYGEVRGVGRLIRSNALNDTLEPILKLAGPPKEFKTIVKWLDAHADEVMTSRLLVAAWPSVKDVPETIVAIEFASAEEAAKFAAPLNEILPKVLPEPVAEPSTEPSGENPKATTPPKPNYYLQQAGSLILLTPQPLTLKKLKPAGGKPFAEDINFRVARNRFNSEPIFVFIDFKAIERQEEEQRQRYEEANRQAAEQLKKEQAAAEEVSKNSDEQTGLEPTDEEKAIAEAEERALVQAVQSPEEVKETAAPDPVSAALSMLASSFFSGESKWPEGIALALAFENDSFDIHALLVNQPGEKSDAVPFMPMLIPGPAFVPESPNILPADTELFVTMSLDLPQIYSAMSRPRPNTTFYSSQGNLKTVHEAPFAAIEKQLKINLKDDLLPLLGSEFALRLPLTGLNLIGLPGAPTPKPETKENSTNQQPSASAGPVLLISLKDKEGVRALLPKLIDSLGFKGASAFAQTERKEDTEMVSYANLFSYAFIGDFLVLSGEPATTRQIVDSYLKRETLAGDSQFKNFTRWQPRPSQGQLYISPALMEGYKSWAEQPGTRVSDETRAFLTRLTTVAQPITYSLSNEGFGPLHELHLPRNLVLMAVAGVSGGLNPPPELRNEGMTKSLMYSIAHAEEQYKKDKGAGSYGTLEQLIAAQMVSKDMIESCGYKFDMTVTGDKFEVFAVPLEYGKTGIMSFYIDQTRVLRGADRTGASAISSDPPIN